MTGSSNIRTDIVKILCAVAVIAMLIVFGAAIWLIDTGFVAALVQFTGLRG